MRISEKAVREIFWPTKQVGRIEDVFGETLMVDGFDHYVRVDRRSGGGVMFFRAPKGVRRRSRLWESWFFYEGTYSQSGEDFLRDWIRRMKPRILLKGPETEIDAIDALYRLVQGEDYDRAIRVAGWPKANEATNLTIARIAMDFERERGSSFPGGIWLNCGFSTDNDLPDWEVIPAPMVFPETPWRYELAHTGGCTVAQKAFLLPGNAIHREGVEIPGTRTFTPLDEVIRVLGLRDYATEEDGGTVRVIEREWRYGA